jgi:integrase
MTVVVRSFKGTNAWEVDIVFELPNGQKIRERRKSKLTSKTGAQRWGEARERELYEQHTTGKSTAAKAPTVREYAPIYIAACTAERMAGATLSGKRTSFGKYVVPVLGNVRLTELNAQHVLQLKTALGALSPRSANCRLDQFRAMLRHAVEAEVIEAMPVKIAPLKEPKRERGFYSFRDFDRLIGAAVDEQLAAILLGGHAGLRLGEVVGVEVEDVDFHSGVLTVRRTVWLGRAKAPKSCHERTIPLTATLAATLRAYLGKRTTGRVFLQANGKPVHSKLVRRWLLDAQDAAGLPRRGHFHELRHTFISHMALRGVPAHVMKELAGHHDISVTGAYLHLASDSKAQAVRTLERGRAWRDSGDVSAPLLN